MKVCREILQGATAFETNYMHQEPGIRGLVFVYWGEDHKKYARAIEEARKKIDAER